jgi:hypothetical protein
MALDDRGHVFYAWNGADHHAYVAASTDEGRNWGAPIDLTPPGVTDTALPRPAATGDGRLFVAYLGSTNAPGKAPYSDYCNILLTPCDDGAYAHVSWNGYMTAVADVFSTHPRLQTATIDPPNRPLLYGSCSADGGCKAELDFIDAKYSPGGEPFAAFVDDCGLQRDFIPVFGQDMGRCGDNLGEGIVGRLASPDASTPPASPPGTPGRCGSRRTTVVHVPRRLLRSARSFDVLVAGKTVKRGAAPRHGVRVDLHGLPRGPVAVVLRVHPRRGRTVSDLRLYHPCTRRATRH